MKWVVHFNEHNAIGVEGNSNWNLLPFNNVTHSQRGRTKWVSVEVNKSFMSTRSFFSWVNVAVLSSDFSTLSTLSFYSHAQREQTQILNFIERTFVCGSLCMTTHLLIVRVPKNNNLLILCKDHRHHTFHLATNLPTKHHSKFRPLDTDWKQYRDLILM